MIRDQGIRQAELEVRMYQHVEKLKELRVEVAGAMQHWIDNTKRLAGTMDVIIGKAIADAEAMIGAPEQLKAAE